MSPVLTLPIREIFHIFVVRRNWECCGRARTNGGSVLRSLSAGAGNRKHREYANEDNG